MGKEDLSLNKKAQKKAVKQIKRYSKGNFGPDDGSHKPTKNIDTVRKMIVKEKLTETYLENKNL